MTLQDWALAEVDELAARVGPIDPDDTTRAEAALEDASALVLDEASNPAWTRTTVPRAVRTVVLAIARRKFANPDDTVTETDTEGPYGRTEQRAASAVGVYLTEAEARIVRRYRPCGGKGLWTQPTTRGEWPLATGWVEDQYGAELFPIDSYPYGCRP